jgi:hypothetical protein
MRGIADAAAMDAGPPIVEAVVTLPPPGSALRSALGERLDAHATRDGFGYVATSARERLVFLVPFIDATGAETLGRLLMASPANERIVVVRPDARGVRWHSEYVSLFCSAGARIFEYWRLPSSSSPNARPETFHAKIALADADLAYVGSSNFMISSLDGNLECGVLVRGETARVIDTVIAAVLAVSVFVAGP